MKTALGAFTALLLADAIYIQPAHAQVQIQPGSGFSVQINRDAPPPPDLQREERLEERLREGFYGSGSEEWREERLRDERRERGRCYRMINRIERDRCLDNSDEGR